MKNRKMRKVLGILLSAVMVLSVLPAGGPAGPVFAGLFTVGAAAESENGSWANGTEGSGTWSYQDGVLIISGEGTMPGNCYNSPWRGYAGTVRKIVIGSEVESVGGRAFEGFTVLEYVYLPESVTCIGNGAFGFCTALEDAVLPMNLTILGTGAFSGCTSLKHIEIHGECTTVSEAAFSGCTSLVDATLAGSTERIDTDAFYGCSSFSDVYFYGVEASWDGLVIETGNDYFEDAQVHFAEDPGTPYCVGGNWYNGDDGSGRWYVNYETSRLTITGTGKLNDFDFGFPGWYGMFADMVESVEIKDGITGIGSYYFYGCSCMSDVILPGSVTDIGDFAFAQCDALGTVAYDGNSEEWNMIRIGEGNLSLTGAEMDYTVTGTWRNGDAGSGFWTVRGSELYVNGSGAIGSYNGGNGAPWTSFADRLTSVNIDEPITGIGDSAFADLPGVVSIYLPQSLLSIGAFAFGGCSSLTDISLPDTVTTIGDFAFDYCTSLERICIPAAAISLETCMFRGCSNLDGLSVSDGNPVYDSREGCCAIIETATDTLFCGVHCSMIPDGVKHIGNHAFYDCDALVAVTIPSSVESVGSYAFCNCDRLESAVIPDGTLTVGEGAFMNCPSLERVTVAESVTALGAGVFSDCISLTDFRIPAGVATVTRSAFSGCTSLSSIGIHAGVTTVGSGAFYGCTALEYVDYAGTESSWSGITVYENNEPLLAAQLHCRTGGVWTNGADGSGTWELDTYTGILTVSGTGKLPDYAPGGGNLPPWVADNYEDIRFIKVDEGITSIGEFSFYHCSGATGVSLPDSLTAINSYAFQNCTSLTALRIPAGVTRIGFGISMGCTALSSLTVDPGNTCYDSRSGCNAVIATLQNELVTGCKRTIIPSDVQIISDYAFAYCSSLKYIEIPSGVTYVGDGAFCSCTGLTSVVLPDGLAFLGESAFECCSGLETLVIPGSLQTIGYGAFYSCGNLYAVTFEEGVKSTGKAAFAYCSRLSTLEIPLSMESINQYAFAYCSSLSDIVYAGSAAEWNGIEISSAGNEPLAAATRYFTERGSWQNDTLGSGTWAYNTYDRELTVSGTGQMYDYNAQDDVYPPWQSCMQTVRTVTVEKGIEKVGDWAFTQSDTLEKINLPDDLEAIGYASFAGNTEIREIAVPDSVRETGAFAFAECLQLTRLKLSSDLYEIPRGMCADCMRLAGVRIPDGVWKISEQAFEGCSMLTDVYVPDVLSIIDARAFALCTSLRGLRLNESLIDIGEEAFRDCVELEKINIPHTVENILESSFSGCTSLRSIDLSCRIYEICAGTFIDCENLESVVIPAGVTAIRQDAFYNNNSLTNVYFNGSWEQWDDVYIENGNDCLDNAQICCINGGTWQSGNNGSLGSGTWRFDPVSGFLKFEGTGKMPDFDYTNDEAAPWLEYADRAAGVEVGEGITVIGAWSFGMFPLLEEVRLPSTLRKIGLSAFYECVSLQVIEIPQSVNTIGETAFYGCRRLPEITVTGELLTVQTGTFAMCEELRSVTLPDSVDEIQGGAFLLSGLEQFRIPAGVTDIPEACFEGCGQLERIVIPSGVTLIEAGAFSCCDSLRNVFFDGTQTQWNNGVTVRQDNEPLNDARFYFGLSDDWSYGTNGEGTWSFDPLSGRLTVSGDGATPDYPTDYPGWYVRYHELITSVEFTEGMTGVGSYYLYNCPALNYVDFGPTVTDIGRGCFSNSRAVGTVRIPRCISEIENGAFNFCDNLSAVYFGGTEEQWLNSFNVYGQNDPLLDAYVVYCCTEYELTLPDLLCTGTSYCVWDFVSCTEGYNMRESLAENADCCWTLTDGTGSSVVCSDPYYTPSAFDAGKAVTLTLDCDNFTNGPLSSAAVLITPVRVSAVPGSGLKVDNEQHIIYGFIPGQNILDIYDLLTIETGQQGWHFMVPSSGRVRTGDVVNLCFYLKQAVSFTIILFGDVNCDGYYDGQDAVLVNCMLNGLMSSENTEPWMWLAADCDHDGMITAEDAAILNEAGSLLTAIDRLDETSLASSSVYQEYLSLIDQCPAERETPQESPSEEAPQAPAGFLEKLITLIKSILSIILMNVFG